MAVFDHATGELLICEIKTVFDHFRTEFQVSNITEDRVNFEKALQQLNVARNALLAEQWSLRDVVGSQGNWSPGSELFQTDLFPSRRRP
jgi:hypothetical protein